MRIGLLYNGLSEISAKVLEIESFSCVKLILLIFRWVWCDLNLGIIQVRVNYKSRLRTVHFTHKNHSNGGSSKILRGHHVASHTAQRSVLGVLRVHQRGARDD